MPYYIYRLVNNNYHYIGSTPDPYRRIRQHNKELKGGAKVTSSKPGIWYYDWLLMTFMNKNNALSLEYHLKHPLNLNKKRGNRLRKNINYQLEQIDITIEYVFLIKYIIDKQIFMLIDINKKNDIIYQPKNYIIMYVDKLSYSITKNNLMKYFKYF